MDGLVLGRSVSGHDFVLPLDAATRRLAVIAMSGAGKSNTAVVLAEAMFYAGIPWVAIDPKGDWWGVRSAGDRAPGLPIPIFGGHHGDLPLEPTAGKLIADLIIDQRLTCVLDVSDFDTRQQMWGFLADLGETLMKRNRKPLHLFLEEADDFIPQTTREGGNQARCLGVWQRVVKRGRTPAGLGSTQITQRTAALNNDTLFMADALIALRTVGPGDLKAVRGWLEHSGAAKEIAESLPTLADGEAWVSSPAWLRRTKRIQFNRRRTFDSGATPVVIDDNDAPPATLADIDLEELRERMAETIERVEADDPRKLHATIADLQRRLTAAEKPERVTPEMQAKLTEYEHLVRDLQQQITDALTKLAVADEDAELFEAALADVERKWGEAEDLIQKAFVLLEEHGREARQLDASIREKLRLRHSRPAPAAPSPRPASVTPASAPPSRPSGAERQASPPIATSPGVAPAGGSREPAGAGSDVKLAKAERAILRALAQNPAGLTRQPMAILTGYAYSGGFRNSLSALRTAGYIDGGNEHTMSITSPGLEALGPFEPLPVGRELLEFWLTDSRLGKAERLVLRHLGDVWPQEMSGQDVATVTGYEYSGGFRNTLSKLRTLGLIEGSNARMAAAAMFFEGGS